MFRITSSKFMRRCPSVAATSLCTHQARRCTTAASTGADALRDSARAMLDASEREQQEKEGKVNNRSVVFASGSSSDNRPRVAAAEAFDIACAALPRPPNFCYMNITLDYSAMLDAPEVVWYQLCQANGATPSSIPSGKISMIGGAVNYQRVGGNGFIQVMLGCIPDLSMDVFTFDAVPEKEVIHAAGSVPPFACFASIDAKLMLQHEALLGYHLSTLAGNLGPSCKLLGGVYPPVGGAGSKDKKSTVSRDELEESIFFFNDRVYRGSAAGAVLRSRHVKSHQISVVPSIAVRSNVTISGVSQNAETTVCKIESLGGMPATDYVKDVYTTEIIKETSKVFLGVPSGSSSSNAVVPVTFFANPKNGDTSIYALLPYGMETLKSGDVVSFVVDDVELDTEAAANELLQLHQRLTPVAATKDITVAREGRKSVVTSSCAGIHFSNRLMNVTAQRTDIVSLGLGNSASVMTAPSILQRVVGMNVTTGGVYTPGQIVNVGPVTSVAARCSTYTVFEGID